MNASKLTNKPLLINQKHPQKQKQEFQNEDQFIENSFSYYIENNNINLVNTLSSIDSISNVQKLDCQEVLIKDIIKEDQSLFEIKQQIEDIELIKEEEQDMMQDQMIPKHQKNLLAELCEKEQELIIDNYQKELLQNTIQQDQKYQIDGYYFKNQKQISISMRAILIDWLMEVSAEFLIKRQTLYLAIYFIDKWMMAVHNIPKNKLQLIGITAMFIASKQEEVVPYRSSEFIRVSNYAYEQKEIFELELQMMSQLDWNINPPTINFYSCFLQDKWDFFMEQNQSNNSQVYFRKSTEESYKLLRFFNQILDAAYLSIHTHKYKSVALITSIMYLTLGIEYQNFDKSIVYHHFSNSSIFLTDQNFQWINNLFQQFLDIILGIQLFELLPTIQYCSMFFMLDINYDLPKSLKNRPELYQNNLEDFLSFSTYNQSQLQYVKQLLVKLEKHY